MAGCATPVGVKPAGLRGAYLEINSSALSKIQPGYNTGIVLHRYDLIPQFENDPESVLSLLHQKAAGDDDRRDLRFALAELNFLYAEILEKSLDINKNLRAPDYFLTSAVYAYHFLLGKSREAPPSPYDNRFREACDIYNRALGKGLATGENGRLVLQEGIRNLPVGQLSMSVNTGSLRWRLDEFEQIRCSDDYLVRGFVVRNRSMGLGSPLIAVASKKSAESGASVIPLTAFLRIHGGVNDFGAGPCRADLELYTTYDEMTVNVNGFPVPLESDSTAPIAYALDNSAVWSEGLRRFFMRDGHIRPQLTTEPYERGRIPVVFVHGTASDPVWWADIFNTLRGDPQIRKNFRFWFFQYDSARPIVDSADAFRTILDRKRRELDPDAIDPGLDQMIAIGHSQGGLIVKEAVVRTGDRLWRALSEIPLDQMDIPQEGEELLRRWLFIEPLPFVKRVIFIATPHRGSFLAQNWILNLFRRIVSLPVHMIRGAVSLINIAGTLRLPNRMEGRLPTSLDGMSPENPVLRALADIPVAPGVVAHSIIAVKGDGDPLQGDDGVVEYRSAHLEGVASEVIVRSEHSCQGHPLTIEEVRRILLEHLASRQ